MALGCRVKETWTPEGGLQYRRRVRKPTGQEDGYVYSDAVLVRDSNGWSLSVGNATFYHVTLTIAVPRLKRFATMLLKAWGYELL